MLYHAILIKWSLQINNHNMKTCTRLVWTRYKQHNNTNNCRFHVKFEIFNLQNTRTWTYENLSDEIGSAVDNFQFWCLFFQACNNFADCGNV